MDRLDRREAIGEFVNKAAGHFWAGAFISAGSAIGMSAFFRTSVSHDDAQRIAVKPDSYEVHDKIDLNNIPVRIIGVSHIGETFYQNLDDIQARVRQARVVVLEYFYKEIREKALPGLRYKTPPEERMLREGIDEFFAGIGSICAEERKDVVVINPESPMNQLLELYTLTGLPISLLGSDLGKVVNTFLGKKVQRSHLIRAAGYGVAASTWLSNIDHFRLEENRNKLEWCELDFRDVKAAENLENLTRNMPTGTPGDEIPIFQGAGHAYIKTYLEDPTLRQAKITTYPHHLLVSQAMQRFHFNPQSQKWVQVL